MTAQLVVDGLSLNFRTRHGTVRALDDVSLTLGKGEIVGVVGESGSGKSVTAYTVMGLLDDTAEVTGGSINMGGAEILSATPNTLNALRGREMAMIFQSPRTALNPIRKVGQQIEDVLREHANIQHASSKERRSPRSRVFASRIQNVAPRRIRSNSPAACASA